MSDGRSISTANFYNFSKIIQIDNLTDNIDLYVYIGRQVALFVDIYKEFYKYYIYI